MSTALGDAAVPAASRAEPAVRAPGEARPWVVGTVVAMVVAAGLLWRSRAMFTLPVYEVGDAAANSLLILDAKSLDLLVGHYSRVGFHHPGPAVLYLQALGEALLTDLLRVTPAAHNGQVVAVALLNAAVLGTVAGVVQSWCRRWPAAVAAVAVALAWYWTREPSLADPWIPLVAVPLYLLLLVAAASVATGRLHHLWSLTAAGGLLVHAHVAFTLPVVVLAAAAVTVAGVTTGRGPVALVRAAPRAWATAVAVVGAFLAPVVANTLLHWPGEVPKYLAYSGGGSDTSLGEATAFTLVFWPDPATLPTGLAPALLLVAAWALALLAPGHLRRPLLALTGAAVLAEVLFVVYALVGVDDLTQVYVGYFGWSIPAALLAVVAAGAAARVTPARTAGRALGAGALAAVALLAGSTAFAARSGYSTAVPELLAQTTPAADGQPLLLDVATSAQPFLDGAALLLQAEREGVEACVTDPAWSVQLTPERICTPQQRARGRVVELRDAGTSAAPTARGHGDVTVLP